MKAIDQATYEAMEDPQVGDRFTDGMYSFWVIVVHRTGKQVATLEGSPPITFPDEGTLRTYSLEKFRERFRYSTDSVKGYWVQLVDRGYDIEGWYSPKDETDSERVVSISIGGVPLLPKCIYCHKEMTGEPYVVKQYPSINQYIPYHTRCFMIAHRGQLSDIFEAEILIEEPRSHNE